MSMTSIIMNMNMITVIYDNGINADKRLINI